jgi:hypothetical protein
LGGAFAGAAGVRRFVPDFEGAADLRRNWRGSSMSLGWSAPLDIAAT